MPNPVMPNPIHELLGHLEKALELYTSAEPIPGFPWRCQGNDLLEKLRDSVQKMAEDAQEVKLLFEPLETTNLPARYAIGIHPNGQLAVVEILGQAGRHLRVRTIPPHLNSSEFWCSPDEDPLGVSSAQILYVMDEIRTLGSPAVIVEDEKPPEATEEEPRSSLWDRLNED